MYLMLSGEGPTDLGSSSAGEFKPGPLALMVDRWLERCLGYSLLAIGQFGYVSKEDLAITAKGIKPLTKRGKKTSSETRYFYKNARALAVMAKEHILEGVDTDLVAVLFRDSDDRASSGRGLWGEKHQSMLSGFAAEQFDQGVPMLAKPISEAWLLCALKNNYQGCAALEIESSSPKSPNNLKNQLQLALQGESTRQVLNSCVEQGRIDINRIDMPSMNAFKSRMDDVLDSLGLPGG